MNKLNPQLLKAGYIPLPAWLILVTVAGFFSADYDLIASHASVMTLEDGPARFIVNCAAWVSGAALILFGIGLWLMSNRIFSGGGLCWVLFGVSMIANGVWPMGSPMHGLYILGIVNIIGPALSLLDIQSELLRERLHGMTVFVSLCAVFYIWVLLNGFDPEGYAGLTQRIFGSINFLWPLVFAWHVPRKIAQPIT